jgi:undecaprenyl diphosphate synthase
MAQQKAEWGKSKLELSIAEKRQRSAERFGFDVGRLPRHVAIIMDGNGRWAQKRDLPRFEGHREGAKTVEKIVSHFVELGIEYLTLYSFSIENWKRPKSEVGFLMNLYERYLVHIRPMLMRRDVRLVHLGTQRDLPAAVRKELNRSVKMTEKNKGMVLALALNYGGRAEIIEAVRDISREYKSGKLRLKDIDEKCIGEHLYTAKLPDPDLLIRTSNEMRISNFLLWQISYSEFYVTKTLWPDFGKADVRRAILAYAGRSRRFGDVHGAKK